MLYDAATAIASTTACAPCRCTILRLSAAGTCTHIVTIIHCGMTKVADHDVSSHGASEFDDVLLFLRIQLLVELGRIDVFERARLFGGCALRCVQRRVMLVLVLRPVQNGNDTHDELFQARRQTERAANFAKEEVPSFAKRCAVQQHSVQLEKAACSAPFEN